MFNPGDKIRSHDFEDRIRPGRGECYVEGVIKEISPHPVHGAPTYVIDVQSRVWDGKPVAFASEFPDSTAYVSVEHNFMEKV